MLNIVGCIETTWVAVGHGPNGSTELAGVHHRVESPPHRFQLKTMVRMSVGKAILHGTFLHLFHQCAVATGFPCIHAGLDQRFNFAHGFL
jgi:hypothetical protein